MSSRVFIKLLASFLLVIAVATGILDVALRRAWEESLRRELSEGLTQKTQLFAARFENDTTHSFPQIAKQVAATAQARVTIIDRQGKVLADSEADPAKMENHATRPEFAAALSGNVGTSSRLSRTVGTEFLYVAVPVRGGAVRLAYPLTSIRQTTAVVRRSILWASAVAVLVAMLLAGVLAQLVARRLRRIVGFAEHIAAGDLSARVAESSSDEIAQVAAALDSTARQLEQNFSALENSRKQLEKLLDSMQDSVISVSEDQRVQWSNVSMKRLLPQAGRVGASIVEAIRDPDLLAASRESLATKRIQTARATAVAPGRVFHVTATPMPGGGVVLVLHDLTEIERVEKTRRDFIANVSHELRTPLTSVQGYTETLLDSEFGKDGGAREFLEIIRKNTARMARLTEDLLTLARVESGEQKMEFESLSTDSLLQDASQSFREVARMRSIDLILDSSPSLPVHADKDAIHQVFANLIDNAIKYAPSGSKIILGAAATGTAVEFFVRDFGPGIPFEHLPRLFERFYRVDTARSRDAGGTGLGLAIVKHIVRNHGGAVRVESELNHGSTFYFTLPLVTMAVAP